MSKLNLIIEVDTDNDSVRIEGEHSMLFYSVWQKMMLAAKAEEQKECIETVRDCIKKHPSSGAILDTVVAAIKLKDKE